MTLCARILVGHYWGIKNSQPATTSHLSNLAEQQGRLFGYENVDCKVWLTSNWRNTKLSYILLWRMPWSVLPLLPTWWEIKLCTISISAKSQVYWFNLIAGQWRQYNLVQSIRHSAHSQPRSVSRRVSAPLSLVHFFGVNTNENTTSRLVHPYLTARQTVDTAGGMAQYLDAQELFTGPSPSNTRLG